MVTNYLSNFVNYLSILIYGNGYISNGKKITMLVPGGIDNDSESVNTIDTFEMRSDDDDKMISPQSDEDLEPIVDDVTETGPLEEDLEEEEESDLIIVEGSPEVDELQVEDGGSRDLDDRNVSEPDQGQIEGVKDKAESSESEDKEIGEQEESVVDSPLPSDDDEVSQARKDVAAVDSPLPLDDDKVSQEVKVEAVVNEQVVDQDSDLSEDWEVLERDEDDEEQEGGADNNEQEAGDEDLDDEQLGADDLTTKSPTSTPEKDSQRPTTLEASAPTSAFTTAEATKPQERTTTVEATETLPVISTAEATTISTAEATAISTAVATTMATSEAITFNASPTPPTTAEVKETTTALTTAETPDPSSAESTTTTTAAPSMSATSIISDESEAKELEVEMEANLDEGDLRLDAEQQSTRYEEGDQRDKDELGHDVVEPRVPVEKSLNLQKSPQGQKENLLEIEISEVRTEVLDSKFRTQRSNEMSEPEVSENVKKVEKDALAHALEHLTEESAKEIFRESDKISDTTSKLIVSYMDKISDKSPKGKLLPVEVTSPEVTSPEVEEEEETRGVERIDFSEESEDRCEEFFYIYFVLTHYDIVYNLYLALLCMQLNQNLTCT